jgi:hypothetical protein
MVKECFATNFASVGYVSILVHLEGFVAKFDVGMYI